MAGDDDGGRDVPFFTDYFKVHAPEGSRVTSSGRDVQTKAGDVENFSTDVQGGHNRAREGVAGLIAEAMVDAPAAAIRNANSLVQMVTTGGGAVIVYGHAVDTFNEGTRGLNGQIMAVPNEERAEKKAALQGQYDGLMETLRGAARNARGQLQDPTNPANVQAVNAGGGLPSSVASIFPEVNFANHAPAELPPDLAELSPAELKEWLLEHPEEAGTLLPVVPVSVRQSIADDLVSQANDITDEDELSEEQLARFAQMLEDFGGDEVIAARFLNEIGQRGLLELNQSVALSALDAPNPEDVRTTEGFMSAIQNVQLGLSGILAAGTRLTGLDSTKPEEAVAPGWFAGLMEEAERKFEYPDNRHPLAGEESYWGHQLLAPLMQNADFGDVQRDVYESRLLQFEQDYAAENHGRLPWEDRSMHPTNTYTRLDWTHGWDGDDMAGYDPVAGLMRQLDDDPEHARSFFSHWSSSDGLPNVDYILHEREWPTDMVDGDREPNDPDAHRYSGLDHVGGALSAATIEGTPDQDSVRIVESIVSSTYDQMPTGDDAPRFSEEDFLKPELRTQVSNILGHYMPSVFTAMGTNPGAPVTYDDGSVFDDARFGEDDQAVQLMLAELGKDGEGREILNAYANGQTLVELDGRLNGLTDPDDVERATTATAALAGRVLGAVDFGATTSIAEDTLSGDESFNQSVEQGVSIATGLLGDTPIGKVPVAGTVMDLIGEGITNALEQDSRGELNQQLGAIFNNTSDQHASVVQSAMWRNVPEGQYPEGMDGTEDLNNLSPEDERAFETWRQDNPWGQEMDSRMSEAGGFYNDGVQEAEQELEAYGR